MKHAALFALVMFAACGSVETPAPNPTPDDPTAPATAPDLATAQWANLPVTCADVLAQDAKSVDGEYILYADADVDQPWSAWCAGMSTGSPAEYLTLINNGSQYNFGSYAAGGAALGTTVITSYKKLRIDPLTLVVDIGDQTFSTSTGAVVHPGGNSVTSMPLGVAMGCGNYGHSDINLGGTMFALDTAYALAGSAPDGITAFSGDKHEVVASGGGNCGWNGPVKTPFNPMGKISAPVLQLRYAR